MTDTARELLAVSIFALRLGFDPREEIGIHLNVKDGTIGIVLLKPFCKHPISISVGSTYRDPLPIVFDEWTATFKAISLGETSDQLIQKIWLGSDFAKSGIIDEVMTKLAKAECLTAKAYKLPGDTEYRCGVCGINFVSGTPGEGDICETCQ